MRSAHLTEVQASALEPRHHFNAIADLFPESLPPVTPALFPVRGTRADEALQAIQQGPQNQADYWQGWRLAAYVKELEYLGWHFLKRCITRPGCRRAIAEYELDRTDPSTAAALASRQMGSIDPSLAGWLALAGVCALILFGVLP